MRITYADIRKFIFHMKDVENKKAATINCYTAAIRFFFEYTLGYSMSVWRVFGFVCVSAQRSAQTRRVCISSSEKM